MIGKSKKIEESREARCRGWGYQRDQDVDRRRPENKGGGRQSERYREEVVAGGRGNKKCQWVVDIRETR